MRIARTTGRRLALLVPLLLAACTAPAPWHKPGGNDATLAKDTSDCRIAARDEALRQYPPGFHGSPALGAGGVMAAQQGDDTHRAVVEAASFNACMQAKGYSRTSRAPAQ